MRAEFLQTGHHDFGQMALAETVGDLDRFIQLAFAQRAGHRRSELPGLLARAVKGDHAVDHDADGPRRHDEQSDHDEPGRPAHLLPHRARIETNGGRLTS